MAGGRLDQDSHGEHKKYPWYLVLWLTGVDYFSTLGYQPGIALLAAGAMSPIATALLILVTLACALPIYAQVAKRSYAGQGSIALLENLLPGWLGKLLVLVLLGFAATDFVITMTLSASDAAEHAIHNPIFHPYVGDHPVLLTLALLAALAVVFLKGFTEAIGLASAVAIPYLLINLVVLARGVSEIVAHPELMSNWQNALSARGDYTGLLLAGVLIFPRLALGLSGFETGVSVMPLVTGDQKARIGGTRKLLTAAAIIMSVMLLLSSFVTTLLIPESAYKEGGAASGRAIAYLAHLLLGPVVGTIYDISTILILWFAGASAMAGMLHLIPRYMPRFGMAPHFVAYSRPLVLLLLGIDFLITIAFQADVNAQGGAYATGVLMLMLSAAVAASLALWREDSKLFALYCWGIVIVFAYTLADNVHSRPDGLIIAAVFIGAILVISGISRSWRSIELRVSAISFVDEESSRLWEQIANKKVNLAPIRTFVPATVSRKEAELKKHYALTGPIAFLHVELLDNRSDFSANLMVRVRKAGEHFHIEVTQALAIANTVAFISETLDPVRLFLGLSRKSLVSQALRYLLLGEGETGMMVYTILVRHWDSTPEDDVRPLIFLMSD